MLTASPGIDPLALGRRRRARSHGTPRQQSSSRLERCSSRSTRRSLTTGCSTAPRTWTMRGAWWHSCAAGSHPTARGPCYWTLRVARATSRCSSRWPSPRSRSSAPTSARRPSSRRRSTLTRIRSRRRFAQATCSSRSRGSCKAHSGGGGRLSSTCTPRRWTSGRTRPRCGVEPRR